MNVSLYNHFKVLFRLNSKFIGICLSLTVLILFAIYFQGFLYKILCNSLMFVGFVFFAITKIKNSRNHNNIKNEPYTVELLLLPVNENDFNKFFFFRDLFVLFPLALLGSTLYYGMEHTNLKEVESFYPRVFIVLTLFSTIPLDTFLGHRLRINLWLKIITFPRIFLFYIISMLMIISAYYADDISPYKFPWIMFTLDIIIMSIYFLKGSIRYLDEQVLYKKKKFRPLIDIPSILVTASLMLFVLNFSDSVSSKKVHHRKPASKLQAQSKH